VAMSFGSDPKVLCAAFSRFTWLSASFATGAAGTLMPRVNFVVPLRVAPTKLAAGRASAKTRPAVARCSTRRTDMSIIPSDSGRIKSVSLRSSAVSLASLSESDKVVDNSVDVLGIDRRPIRGAHLFDLGPPLRLRHGRLVEHHVSGVASQAVAVDEIRAGRILEHAIAERQIDGHGLQGKLLLGARRKWRKHGSCDQ